MTNRRKIGIIATAFIWSRIEAGKFAIMGIASFWTAVAMLAILFAVNYFIPIPAYRWWNIPFLVIYVIVISSFYLFLFPYLEEKNFQMGENLNICTTVGIILAIILTLILMFPLVYESTLFRASLASCIGLVVVFIAAIVSITDNDGFGILLIAAMISGFIATLTSGIIFGLTLFSPITGLIIGLVSGLITIILAIVPVTLVWSIEKAIDLHVRLIEKF